MNLAKRFVLAIAIFSLLHISAAGQKVTGKWYGTGFVDVNEVTNNYMCELLITQQGNQVTGEFNYFFRNGYFSNKIKGTFSRDSRFLYLSLAPVMYNRTVNTLIGVDCPMHGEFTLKVARAGSTITGGFISDDLHKYTCASLRITFSKMADNEPTLKERLAEREKEDTTEEEEVEMPVTKDSAKPLVAQQPPVAVAAPSATPGTVQPSANDSSKTIISRPATAVLNPAAADSAALATKTDSIKNIGAQPPVAIAKPATAGNEAQIIKQDTVKTIINQAPTAVLAPTMPLANVTAEAEKKVTERVTATEKVLEVYDDSVRVDLYDNGVLDYDTVSVFYNKKLVQYQQQLETQKPISFYVHVSADESGNELIMYAENLGRIPPNSALMVITDSGHRYEVSLTSDFQKNAAIRLRRGQKPLTQ